jgi:hypothetical protein
MIQFPPRVETRYIGRNDGVRVGAPVFFRAFFVPKPAIGWAKFMPTW